MAKPPNKVPAATVGVWKRLRRVCFLLVVSLLGFYGVFYFAQTSLVAEGEPGPLAINPKVHGREYEDVAMPVGDETTFGWYMPVPNARGVVLFCHGNGGNMTIHYPATKVQQTMGFSTMMFDYGGFGLSTGQPTEARVYADARAAWRWLTVTKSIPAKDIIIWGASFGGGVACQLATEVSPGALVLESTYLSVPEAASDHTPGVPWNLLVRCKLANKDKIGKVKCPVMIIHSTEDTLFPIRHGRGLYERANKPKILIEIRGDHGQATINRDPFVPQMDAFLEPYFPHGGDAE
ncbi:MAG: alpha/beta hydrolase [Candidatus Hydrogenedentes bacterium]|nr:alpha/beta hydrolase [Candidatus Hydrogenedentota bacterium]